ncbi:DUF3515 domain-containing protein [Georgenia sp. TF02-10]|uniref:DUF3515 family protein n=1 Tax=Georgenia sp. TF02-10 TaxID=2917725 RepID=UPI001FA704FB|nr:DUF3515 family protein [Georgenia sp. TF02-10]UNX53867.1 DUF3515 domain-containing protein [Georgenia sp. TF02-10]
MARRPVPRRRRALGPAAGGLVAAAVLAGCAAPVSVTPGEEAREPVCAEVLQATPDDLGGLERRSTTAQAATAWGEPAVTLRCGVSPPGPTTDRCLSIEADGQSVDWIAVPDEDAGAGAEDAETEAEAEDAPDDPAGRGGWTFVTYGRIPAVEVVVPVEQAGEQPTAALVELAPAVAVVPAERFCVGPDDAG